MNLFVESLADYLKSEWDNTLKSADSPKEARFILQSFGPDITFELFAALETHRLLWTQRHPLECHFRVATKLWEAWGGGDDNGANLDQKMRRLGGLGTHGERPWIDEEDRLAWYRSRTRPAGVEGLVVVLAGFEHASDQGSLADFHRVDEHRVWQLAMGESFRGWIQRLSDRHGLEVTEPEIERFDDALQQLSQITSWQLAKLAEYLETVTEDGQDLYSFGDLMQGFYWRLPFWGIPPLKPEHRDIGGKKGAALLKNAAGFIAHQKLKTPTEQKKAWAKLAKAFADGILELPEPIPGSAPPYQSPDEFKTTLHEFIHKADANAKAKLMQADLLPVLKVLKLKEVKPPPPPKITKLTGMSIEVMLQAVWETLNAFQHERLGNSPLFEALAGVRVILIHFKHDLTDDRDNGQDGDELARALLQGCLGGLDKVFEHIGWHLPVDADQARLPRERWEKEIPLALDTSAVSFGTGKTRPHVLMRVELAYIDGTQLPESHDDEDEPYDQTGTAGMRPYQKIFRWDFGPTQPERVRYQCAKTVLDRWDAMTPGRWMLPAFRLPMEKMTALYFAADADEANRLIAQALTDLNLVNLLESPHSTSVDPSFQSLVGDLVSRYRTWLQCFAGQDGQGYYAANTGYFHSLTQAYMALAEAALDNRRLGSIEILRRLYKVCLLIDGKSQPNDDYLRCAVAFGISLPVMELDHHRNCFLRDSFPEVVGGLALGRDGKCMFGQLLKLVELHRPLAGLVVNAEKRMSADIKSFGLLHYLGERPPTEKSLAVQTLLREEESDDDDDVGDSIRSGEESAVVLQVLNDYLRFYPFAHDGLRILAVHVEELATVLSGVDRFLRDYLKDSNPEFPPFHCTVMVYTISSSPMVMENRLAAWREALLETCRERDRPLRLTVGHRYAPDQDRMCHLLRQEAKRYDLAFLFHFLEGELAGEIETALPFQYDYNAANISPFPICEYPRPIQEGNVYRRQSLLSNRRLRLQARHADLSARLRQPQNTHSDHVIYGLVNYEPWRDVVEGLHHKSQWVACIDPFVDKNLLCGAELQQRRKIVGFASGLGDYGELNLTISTDQDTLQHLTGLVRGQLDAFLPFQQPSQLDSIASQVVGEAEAIIGLSSLHAVVGQGEKIREVVGFAAIRRALGPNRSMSQLLPVDALGHWFADSEVNRRPDLLQVSLTMRGEDELPLIEAVVIECKFAQHNPAHLLKATDQVCDGLSHLTQLFAPNRSDTGRMSFDRRYWWAQLQRAITSRSLVNLPDSERRKLDHALESLTEGYFEIAWQGVIFTFWTDDPSAVPPVLTPIALPASTLARPFQAPEDFALWHLALGYEGLADLFAHPKTQALLDLSEKPAITISAEVAPPPAFSQPSIPKPPTESSVQIIPVSAKPSSITPPEPSPTPIVQPKDQPETVSITPTPSVEIAPPVSPPVAAVPERLLIGTRGNGDAVYWNYGHPDLNNRHLLIFGASGSGKTYGIQCLLAEMARQRLRSLIIDYTDGFLTHQTEPLFREIANPRNHFVVAEKLPINPFRRQLQVIDPSIPAIEENPFQVASRVASIFSSVFETMGDQQNSALIRVLEAGIGEGDEFSCDDMLSRLYAEDSASAESLASKLEPLVRSQPFRQKSDSAWEQMLADEGHWVQVLQLKGLARDLQKIVTEFALWDLYDYACNSGNKNRPIPVVLDEIQNLDHRSDSPIDKMLREGRKFGLSLMLATQTTSQFDQEARDRLFQAGHKLFFKPANTEIDRFASLLSQTTGISKNDWGTRLAKLQKGECWSLGPVKTSSGALREEAVLVSVTPLEKRFTAG